MLGRRQNTQVDKPEEATVVDLQEPVSLSFALRYLNSFAKASPLSSQVRMPFMPDISHQSCHAFLPFPAVQRVQTTDLLVCRADLTSAGGSSPEERAHACRCPCACQRTFRWWWDTE